jgi:hypothetical protein
MSAAQLAAVVATIERGIEQCQDELAEPLRIPTRIEIINQEKVA